MQRSSRLLILCLFALSVLYSCGQTSNKKQYLPDKTNLQIIDTANIAILPFTKWNTHIFKNSKPVPLTETEIRRIDSLLKQCVDSFNLKQLSMFGSASNIDAQNIVIDISKYKRQYFPVMNQKGETEVWVNCFCNDLDLDWKKEVVVGVDGGICFFNVIINLSTGKFYKLLVNGDA
jgi:hypothetical protein